MPWTRSTPAFAHLRLAAVRSVVFVALMSVMVCCSRSEPEPPSVDAVQEAAPGNAEPPAYSPETLRADLERLVSVGDYDGAARLLEAADVERQVAHDAAGYLAVAEYMIVLPGVQTGVEFDRTRDWVFPGTSDVIENMAWQKAATEFASRYNALRASEAVGVEGGG